MLYIDTSRSTLEQYKKGKITIGKAIEILNELSEPISTPSLPADKGTGYTREWVLEEAKNYACDQVFNRNDFRKKIMEAVLYGVTLSSLPSPQPVNEGEGMKWIKIEDNQPEQRTRVIGYFPDKDETGRFVNTASWDGFTLTSDFPNSTSHWFIATHWMPLPPPPPSEPGK